MKRKYTGSKRQRARTVRAYAKTTKGGRGRISKRRAYTGFV